jgi:hypothetical protein
MSGGVADVGRSRDQLKHGRSSDEDEAHRSGG